MATSKRKHVTPRPHLVLKLRKGWTFDSAARCFSKSGHDPVRPGADLPKYTRIKPQVPSLARKRTRTAAEDDLARGIQIVPPRGVSPAKLLKHVEAWPCVEKAWVSPEVSPAEVTSPR